MLHFELLSTLLLLFLSTVTASFVPAKRAQSSPTIKASGASLLQDIVHPTDIVLKPLGRPGQPLSADEIVRFFLTIQLELYRKTVQHDGDGVLPRSPPFKRVFNDKGSFNDKLQFMLTVTRDAPVTFGSSLLAVESILHGMLYPPPGMNGFNEGTWELYLKSPRKTPPMKDIDLGTITLFKIFGDSGNITADTSSSSISQQSSQFSSPSLTSTIYPVIGTDVFLEFNNLGKGLPSKAVIWPLQLLIGKGWTNVASRQGVSSVSKTVIKTQDGTGAIEVSVQPSMGSSGKGSLMTDTDMVEAAFGIITLMLNHRGGRGFGTATVTVRRRDERGMVIVVGDIVIAETKVGILNADSENTSSIETA